MNKQQLITRTTTAWLNQHLESFGNNLNQQHKDALAYLVSGITEMAYGQRQGRWAYALPTGMGKTSAIRAFLVNSYIHDRDLRAAVATSHIDTLFELHRGLVKEHGIPKERVGIYHTRRREDNEDELYIEPNTIEECLERPYLLLTQAKIRSQGSSFTENSISLDDRDVVLWDESLISARGIGLVYEFVKEAMFSVYNRAESSHELKPLSDWLRQCKAIIDKETNKDSIVDLPLLSDEARAGWITLLTTSYNFKYKVELSDFILASASPVRLSRVGGNTLLNFSMEVPRELDSVIILDASTPIRQLMTLDETIKDAELEPGAPALSDIKTYEAVTIEQILAYGGKEYSLKNSAAILSEVESILGTIETDEDVLIIAHKALLDQFRNYFITLKPGGSRIHLTNWGQHTSSNLFNKCQHVILAGIMNRSDHDIAAHILGSKDDIAAQLTSAEVERIKASERDHVVYQALSRGSMRNVEAGQAEAMKAYIISNDMELERRLRRVLPGCSWKIKTPAALPCASAEHSWAVRIVDKLEELEAKGETKISITKLKKMVGFDMKYKLTWQNARDKALMNKRRWVVDGRCLCRS